MEATFQKIVLTIAIILLIVLLIIINMTLTASKSSANWPPIVTECPDYWIDLSGNGSLCFNSKDLGTCKHPSFDSNNNPNPASAIDFSKPAFSGPDALCAKQRWAKSCNVAWDGITYGYGSKNPCEPKPK